MNDIRALLAEQNEKIDGKLTSRLDRENNVIIYGIDESEDDTEAVSDNLPKPPNPIRMHRLGKQDLPKIRPLKVEFSSRQEALSILVKSPKLPLKEFPNVNFKNDNTPRFREELTSMYKEIEQRRAHGENLRVKFVFVTPKRPREEEESPNKNAAKINKGKANSSRNEY
ncbi:hypothetical protein JTB14_011743 [Gonioctena quinquepunctata]|nr:hypothetical protein JTB14_011743 [Gonioctena quinquepunctata]